MNWKYGRNSDRDRDDRTNGTRTAAPAPAPSRAEASPTAIAMPAKPVSRRPSDEEETDYHRVREFAGDPDVEDAVTAIGMVKAALGSMHNCERPGVLAAISDEAMERCSEAEDENDGALANVWHSFSMYARGLAEMARGD